VEPIAPSGAVTLDLAGASAFPAAPPVQRVYAQIDDRMGAWSAATPLGAAGTFTTTPLRPGLHVARAWASVGLEGDPRVPLVGSITAQPFVVPAREGALSLDLSADQTSTTPGGAFPFRLGFANDRSTAQGFSLFLLLVGPGGAPTYT